MNHPEPSRVLTSETGLLTGDVTIRPAEAEEEERNQEHFKTDHLLPDLKRRTISGGVVTVSAQAAKFALSLVSTMILARLLTPRDFGLVAMVTTVTSFLIVFKDAGLSIATVQREKITHAQVSNLFWINLGVSALGALILDSRVTPIMLVFSTAFLIAGFRVQHLALLKRQMRFKAIAIIEVGSMATGVLVGVIMALLRYGYWSLVGSSLSAEIAGFLLTGLVSRWRPQLPTRHSGIGPLVSFGVHRTASDFIICLARGSDSLLIGRFYGPAALGLYTRAGALLIRPLELFLSPINAVFIPTLSRLQSQPQRYRSTFLRLYEAIAFTGFFFTGLCFALARPLTLVLLGPKWEQAAVIFGGFTIAALCVPLANASGWLFISQGRGRDLLRTQSINSGAIVLSFLVGLPFGPVGVAIAFSIANLLVRLPIYYFNVGRCGPVRTADLWRIFFRHLPIWVVVFALTRLMLAMVANLAPLAQLLICAPIGVLAGIGFICMFEPQRKMAVHLLETVRELKRTNGRKFEPT